MASRITIDYDFAAAPHELISDPRVSPSAFRLWCVLLMMNRQHEPPDIDRLQAHMGDAGRRSVYRWLSELEETGWLEWQRSPGKSGVDDRFMLKTRQCVKQSPPEPVPPRSQDTEPVPPRSQPVPPRSQDVPNLAQVDVISPLLEPQKSPPKNHENHESVGVGDRAREKLFTALRKRGIGRSSALAICELDTDDQTILASIDNLYNPNEPRTMGGIIQRLLDVPPERGKPYEQQSPRDPSRRSPPAGPADPGRNGTGLHNRRADRAGPARAPRPGERAYYRRFHESGADGPAEPE